MKYLLVCFNKSGNSYYSFDGLSAVKSFVIKYSITNYAIYKLYERSSSNDKEA